MADMICVLFNPSDAACAAICSRLGFDVKNPLTWSSEYAVPLPRLAAMVEYKSDEALSEALRFAVGAVLTTELVLVLAEMDILPPSMGYSVNCVVHNVRTSQSITQKLFSQREHPANVKEATVHTPK